MTNRKITLNDLVKPLAYVALIISGLIQVIFWILPNVTGVILTVLVIIKDISLLAAIVIPAHSFAERLGKFWTILYWIVVVIFIVGLIFGGAKL